MQIRQIKNNKAGFSLTELLAAILILAMVSAVVAGGIPVARDAFNKITVSANAQVLLSTTISALRNQLGTSKVATDESIGESITYLSGKTGTQSQIYLKDGTIYIREYIEYGDKVEGRPLVPSTDGLFSTYKDISYDSTKGIVTINKLTVKKAVGDADDKYVTPLSLKINVIGK